MTSGKNWILKNTFLLIKLTVVFRFKLFQKPFLEKKTRPSINKMSKRLKRTNYDPMSHFLLFSHL